MMVRFLRHGDMAACLLVQGPKARNVFSTREFPIAVRHLTMIFSTSANDSEKTGLKFKLLRFRRDGKKNNFSSEKAQHESQKIASRNTTRHGLRFFDLYIYIYQRFQAHSGCRLRADAAMLIFIDHFIPMTSHSTSQI